MPDKEWIPAPGPKQSEFDALNTQVQGIADQIGRFRFEKGADNPSNWNNAFPSQNDTVIFYNIHVGTLPTGAPTGAYKYGVLMAISASIASAWNNILIYIPDDPANAGIYIKTKNQTSWFKASGTAVSDVS